MTKAIFLKAVIFFLFIPFSGCKKLQDYILKYPGSTHPDCRITKFTSTSNYPQKTGTVHYNKFGNPDSVIFDNITTGQGNFYMFYDDRNRLTDCIDMYTEIGADTSTNDGPYVPNDLRVTNEWRKFIYDRDNRVIGDTLFLEKLYKPGTLRPVDWDGSIDEDKSLSSISKYEYDTKDRVIKKTTQYNGYSIDKIYDYDTNGNLIIAGRQYDEQVNFLRTHKIWMLLTLDYSVNNAYPAVKYNSKGLPLEFDNNPPAYSSFLLTEMSRSKIEYNCK